MCRHLHMLTPFQVFTHVSTSQYPNKFDMIDITGVYMCQHLDASAHASTFSCVGTLPGADICPHITASIKVHMIAITCVGMCQHLDVLAPSQVSAPSRCWHVSTSQHKIRSICRHVDVLAHKSGCTWRHLNVVARVGTFPCADTWWHICADILTVTFPQSINHY